MSEKLGVTQDAVRFTGWLEELEAAHGSMERAIKILTQRDNFETASVVRRHQKGIAFILALHRSSSNRI